MLRRSQVCTPRWTSKSVAKWCRLYVTASSPPFRLAIIGSGPAGFYSAYRVMAKRHDAIVDMYEKLPVPFGLVRFGVAPDHPEVKNCQDRFTEVASSPRFNFIGNFDMGKVGLLELRKQYDAILFAYGASKDRELSVPGEHLQGVYSARAFVGWYNGLPEYASLSPDLQSGDTAVIIGQGNVALDIARILLSGVERLKTTDIAANALDTLSSSKVTKVHVIGRRGPLQASFTIKELRELMQLLDIQFKPVPLHLLPGLEQKLPRAQKRISDLLRNHSNHSSNDNRLSKSMNLDFLQSPMSFNADSDAGNKLASITLSHNRYKNGNDLFDASAGVESTNENDTLKTSLAFRSIGYKSEPLPGMQDLGIEFDLRKGTLPNVAGRVVNGGNAIPGLYCAGWVKRGPTGVIATTMEDAFSTAEIIVSDWAGKASGKPGWEALRSRFPHATDWDDWLKIDAAEREMGRAKGKEREKCSSVDQMLNILR